MGTRAVEITGVRRLLNRLNLVGRSIGGTRSRQVLGEIGTYLTFSIKRRVQEDSLDIFGRALKPYAPQYRFFRQREGLGTKVDLTVTGSMFASLTHSVFADRVIVFFAPGQDRSGTSNPAKAFYLQEERVFFGYTDEDAAKILDLYSVNIEEALSGR